MSTLKTVNIQHPSSASVNAGTDTSGNFLMNSGYGSAATAYGCRAWVKTDGATTVLGSGNVTSVANPASGVFNINFTNQMPDANYCAVPSARRSDTSSSVIINMGISTDSYSTTQCTVRTINTSGTGIGVGMITVAVFR